MLVCMLMSASMAFAQNEKVSGMVFEAETGEPLVGVTVKVDGTNNGSVTDIDGKFTVSVPNSKSMLVFSMIGMNTKKERAKNGMRVNLESQDIQMTEVIVNGQQQIDKRLFTGAATTVDAEKIKLSGMADVSRSLEGHRPRFVSVVPHPSMVTPSPSGWWMVSSTRITWTSVPTIWLPAMPRR